MDTSFGALLLISTRFTLVISPHKISSQVYYFGSLVCVYQLDHQNLKFSLSAFKELPTNSPGKTHGVSRASSVSIRRACYKVWRKAGPTGPAAMDNSLRREHMPHQPRPRGEGRWEVRLYLANMHWWTNKSWVSQLLTDENKPEPLPLWDAK